MSSIVPDENVTYYGGQLGNSIPGEPAALLSGFALGQPYYLSSDGELCQWYNADNQASLFPGTGHFETFDGDPSTYTPVAPEST